MSLLDIIGNIIFWFTILCYAVLGIIYVVMKIKCRNKHNCVEDSCPFREECRKAVYSEKEIAELKALLEKIREKRNDLAE